MAESELRHKATAGEVLPSTKVCNGSDGRWVCAEQIPGLFPQVDSRPTADVHQIATSDRSDGIEQSSVQHKRYVSAVAFLSAFGGVTLLISVVLAVHDAGTYRALPKGYRTGIERLQQGWRWFELPERDKKAIVDQEKLWQAEEKLPSLRSLGYELVDLDPETGTEHALTTFERLVPRWGLRLHQQRPILAVAISLVAFVPVVLVIGLGTWLRWTGLATRLRWISSRVWTWWSARWPEWKAAMVNLLTGKWSGGASGWDGNSTERRWIMSRKTIVLISAGIIFLFGFCVWPTVYRYDHLNFGRSVFPVRMNRITGKTYRLMSSGWVECDDANEVERDVKDATSSVLPGVTGQAYFSNKTFKVDLYNGSPYFIQEIVVNVRVEGSRGRPTVDREYRLSSYGGASPQESHDFSCNTGLLYRTGDAWEWKIVGVK